MLPSLREIARMMIRATDDRTPEPLAEVQCPTCDTTIRARMADAPDHYRWGVQRSDGHITWCGGGEYHARTLLREAPGATLKRRGVHLGPWVDVDPGPDPTDDPTTRET